jgi:hypothetical protein
MISSEVQRTLVKSPPELWAELSDPSTLARHLGELGEIRITHIEPETAVEWEAEDVSGKVQLKASGWGTKVTLTVTRELPEPAPDVPEAQSPLDHEQPAELTPTADPEPETPPAAAPEPALEYEPGSSAEPEPEPEAKAQPFAQAESGDQPEVAVEAAVEAEPSPPSESRRGFFARLFRRGAREQPLDPVAQEPAVSTRSPEVPPEIAAGVEYLSEPPWVVATPALQPRPIRSLEQHLPAHEHFPATEALESDEPVEHTESEDEEPADISAELRAAEEATVEQVTAVLTGVLDRLGAAHHRPFSRS